MLVETLGFPRTLSALPHPPPVKRMRLNPVPTQSVGEDRAHHIFDLGLGAACHALARLGFS